jgi:hypothetical protein
LDAAALQLVSSLVEDLRRKDEDARRKDEDARRKEEDARRKEKELLDDLRHKDAQVDELNKALRSAAALAAQLRFQNLARLRLACVVEVRGVLDMCLREANQHGSSTDVFTKLLANSPQGGKVLDCCNADDKVLSDNSGQKHTLQTLAAELARIKRRLNKDSHPQRKAAQYTGERLLLPRDGLSASDVVIVSCLCDAFGYPVQIVDDLQLADS